MQMLRVLLLSLCTALPAMVYAASSSVPVPAYKVEILVFDSRLPQFEAGELWIQDGTPIADIRTAAESAARLDEAGAADLAGIAAVLRDDPNFRVLVHTHWIQPADARSAAAPVRISTGDPALDGTLRFYLSRFLHVELELAYQPMSGGFAGTFASEAGPGYWLRDQRRVRATEVHYFDHPKFGAIVRVAPVKG